LFTFSCVVAVKKLLECNFDKMTAEMPSHVSQSCKLHLYTKYTTPQSGYKREFRVLDLSIGWGTQENTDF